MNKKAKKVALLGILTSVALVLSYLESILPPIWAAVPGIKVGLANVVIIFLLYRYGVKEAAIVSFIRLFVVALLFGNVMSLAYSFAGASLSIVLMALCKKIKVFSTVGTSIVGGVSHNLGQIFVAIFLFDTVQIGYYMIILAITGTIAGVFIGLAGMLLIKSLGKIKDK